MLRSLISIHITSIRFFCLRTSNTKIWRKPRTVVWKFQTTQTPVLLSYINTKTMRTRNAFPCTSFKTPCLVFWMPWKSGIITSLWIIFSLTAGIFPLIRILTLFSLLKLLMKLIFLPSPRLFYKIPWPLFPMNIREPTTMITFLLLIISKFWTPYTT